MNFFHVFHAVLGGLGICGQLSWISWIDSVRYVEMIVSPSSVVLSDKKLLYVHSALVYVFYFGFFWVC